MRKLTLMLCAFVCFNAAFAQLQQQDKVYYLKTFAKAYGYVKYFHPSDEATEIDWNSFSAFGASEILKSTTKKEVIATLNNLFKPIAPSVIFSDKLQKFDLSAITPKNTEGYQPTYWQHKGVSIGMNNQNDIYSSIRANRFTLIDESSGFGTLQVFVNPEKYKGKKIKYTGWVKLKDDSKGTGHLWLRVDNSDKSRGFFNNMDENPIKSNDWKQYEIVGDVGELASGLFIGCFMKGKGTLFLDDVHLYYNEKNEWIEIPILNSDFEADTIGVKNDETEWTGKSKGYSYTLSNTQKRSGTNSAVIAYKGQINRVKEEVLFDAAPKYGEFIEKEIGPGIFCQIPLNLYGNNENTYPKSETLEQLKDKLNKVDAVKYSQSMYLGNVINTYNVIQHFYPYFDEVDLDWDKELENALQKSLDDKTEHDHIITLQKFTAPLKDGHVYVGGGTMENFVPPINWEWIEDKLVITKVKEDGMGIQVGDIVTKVNDQTSEDYFKEINSRISAGTKGWLNYRAQSSSLFGKKDQELILEVNSKRRVLNRNQLYSYGENDISIQSNNYKLLDDNIYYLNLDTIEMDTITSLLPQLQKAEGIICDLRGYPNGNHDFISHLLKEKDTSRAWMKVSKIIYPDRKKVVGFENHGWEMEPKEPYLGDKKVVFLIDGRSISYAESYMSFIKHYQLATIVGQPTAGANGNINPFTLLGNYTISWTGMKVVKHDGSQHHGIGVLPDIYVHKSIVGMKAGKDEFLEKAIEVILN